MTADQYIKKYAGTLTLGQLLDSISIGTGVIVDDSYGKRVLYFPGWGAGNLSDYLSPEDVSLLDYEIQFFDVSTAPGKVYVVLWDHYEPDYYSDGEE